MSGQVVTRSNIRLPRIGITQGPTGDSVYDDEDSWEDVETDTGADDYRKRPTLSSPVFRKPMRNSKQKARKHGKKTGKEFTGPFKIIVPDDGSQLPLVDTDKVPASATYAEGRLFTVNRASYRKRKTASIQNDHARTQSQIVTHSLDRQRSIATHQLHKGTISYRKSLANLRSLELCLKSFCAESSDEEETPLYGRYNGKSVKDFKHEVNSFMSENNHNNRKLRETRGLIQAGKEDGRLAETEDIMQRFNQMIDKPFKKFELRKNNFFGKKSKMHLPNVGSGPKMVNLHGKGFANFFATGSVVSFL